MISIQASINGLDVIKYTHVTYVSSYASAVIDFYLKVFDLYAKRNGKINARSFAQEILALKRNDYKSLLNCFFNKNAKKLAGTVKNKDGLSILVREDNLCFKLRSVKRIIECLNSLKKDVEEIIGFDFSQERHTKLSIYDKWESGYEILAFLIPNIFDYDYWFSKLGVKEEWGPYQLASALDFKSCPYCNRHYTLSLTNEQGQKMGRPDFDHFLPKAKHPLLALSFFNLIPSCKECNSSSVKGQKSVSYETHISPYENFDNNAFKFSYYPKTYEAMIGKSNELDIFLGYGGDPNDTDLAKKVEGNISLFYLKELYNCHQDIVAEVICKRYISNDRYLDVLKNTFHNFDFSLEDIYRLAYGGYYSEKDFHRRPLSKLIKDIAIEMDLIRSS